MLAKLSSPFVPYSSRTVVEGYSSVIQKTSPGAVSGSIFSKSVENFEKPN